MLYFMTNYEIDYEFSYKEIMSNYNGFPKKMD